MSGPVPRICDTLTPLAEKLRAEATTYKATLALFEREGTTELRDSLIAQKENLLRTKATINEILNPLGYDIDTPLPKRESPEEITTRLKEVGSPAVLDESFGEKGIVSVDITPELREQLKNLSTALTAYEAADGGSPSYIWNEWRNMQTYEAPQQQQFDAIILSYNNDETIRRSSEKIVADMDRAGVRPARFEELIALGITHPDLNKRNEYLVGLGTKESLVGIPGVPSLNWIDGDRCLGWIRLTSEWGGHSRFVCLRK